MNRKSFIQSHGATCVNWTWSWSFVNHDARFIIFGLWEDKAGEKLGLILHRDWKTLAGRKQPGYSQALKHISLVETEGYGLRTFPMKGVPRDRDRGDLSASAIAKFEAKLTEGRLVTLPGGWYVAPMAADYETIAEIVEADEAPPGFFEGAVSSVLVNAYERSAEARRACISHYGPRCQACAMDFGATYGPFGEGYIHVHHIKPIAQCGGEYVVDPITDLIPVCANCHAMIHRRREPLSVEELRTLISVNGVNETQPSPKQPILL